MAKVHSGSIHLFIFVNQCLGRAQHILLTSILQQISLFFGSLNREILFSRYFGLDHYGFLWGSRAMLLEGSLKYSSLPGFLHIYDFELNCTDGQIYIIEFYLIY